MKSDIKSLGLLTILFEIGFLACFVIAAKDWFTSSVEPYPYAASSLILIGILSSWGGYLNFPKLLAQIEKRIGPDESQNIPPSSFRFLIVLGWAALFYVVAAYFAMLQPLSPPRPDDDFAWLGNGIGAMGNHSLAPVGAALAQELGWGVLPILLALVVIAPLLGVMTLSDQLRGECTRKQAVISCALFFVPIAVLASLPLLNRELPLTAALPWGVWFFFAPLAILGGSASHKTAIKSVKRRRFSRWAVLTCLSIAAALFIAINYSLRRAVSPYFSVQSQSQSQSFISLERISPNMRDALIAMEDHAFYQHHGFDWAAIHHALRLDLREGRIKEGGGTITQQLAKNLFLTSDRTVWRKIEEAAYTWELEQLLSKSRILELYLNTIDYGMGQRGIGAAAHYYFHKTPDELTLTESAILVGIVPDPMHERAEQRRLDAGRQEALKRIHYFFPNRYSQEDCERAGWLPINLLIYPDKNAWDRGATCQIPAEWHGVKFYFFANPDEPSPINQASILLKDRLAHFLDDAHGRLKIVGIDHLGVYNDRSTRQEKTVISSHAYGQAIDISGFRFADGSRIRVQDHNNPRVLARLSLLKAMLHRYFDVVVDWDEDPERHQTHFHAEVKGVRPTAPRSIQEPPGKSVDETMAEIRQARRLPPRIRTWLSGRLVRQTSGHSCGEASVATILSNYLEKPVTEPQVVRLLNTENANGTENQELIRAFKTYGVSAVKDVVTTNELLDRVAITATPVVAALTRPVGHWIVVAGEWGDYLLISDPQRGNLLMPKNDFDARSDGEIVYVDWKKRERPLP